ncbi:MAG: MFS transporter [Desulfobulbaceae bacterium]|nr:MFS transporter [Desulfobulbaceae bacterium]
MTAQITLSIAVRFGINFIHWMVLAHLPVLLRSYGLTDLELATVIGLFSLSSMALMLPMGVFSDYFSPRRTLLFGALLQAWYFMSLPAIKTFWSFLPIVFIGGLGTASLLVVSESLYMKLFCQEKRGRRVAIYQLSTYLGYGLGPLAGGILLQNHSYLLFPMAAAGACLVLILGFFLKDSEPIVFSFKEYGNDILRPAPLLLMACIFVMGTHFGVEQTSFSLFMNQNLGLSSKEIGLVFAGLGLWMAAAVPVIGALHDKKKSVFIFLLSGLAVSGIFQVATAWTTGFSSLLTIRLLHTMGDAVALLELSVLVALLFPSRRLGGNSGLLYAIRTLATFSAAIISGGFNKEWGYGASFLGNGIFVILFALASALFIWSSRKRMQAVGWVK